MTILRPAGQRAMFFAIALLAIAIVSFWMRSLREAQVAYEPQCVAAPSAECIDSLRKAARWSSPFNASAVAALSDLETISNGPTPWNSVAAEARSRAIATSRSILNPWSPRLPADLNPGWAILTFLSFLGWTSAAILMIRNGWRSDGSIVFAGLSRYGLVTVVLFGIWLVALRCA